MLGAGLWTMHTPRRWLGHDKQTGMQMSSLKEGLRQEAHIKLCAKVAELLVGDGLDGAADIEMAHATEGDLTTVWAH